MQRQPLQSIGNKLNRPGFPIFDDFKAKPTAKPTTRLHTVSNNSTKNQTALPQKDFSKALYMVVLIQRHELNMATLRTSFAKLVNHCLLCKLHKANQAVTETKPTGTKPSATPKKRRLDEENHTGVESTGLYDEMNGLGTPPRVRANFSRASTPHNPATRRIVSTPNQSRTAATTPAGPSAANPSDKLDRSIMEEDVNCSADATAPSVSLAERLEMVEASLQKLKTMGAQSTTKAPGATSVSERSPARAAADRDANLAHTNKQAIPTVSQKTATSSDASMPATMESKASPANVNVNMPSFAGRGNAVHKPMLADHDLLQAAIQRATKASIKTLLKPREALAQASELRDKLHTYQQDSAKVEAALQPVSANTAGQTDAAAQLTRLETSIVNYHHAASDLFPLSPLGDQSIRGAAMSPVPLSQMSLLQDKMLSWKAKYTAQPVVKKTSD